MSPLENTWPYIWLPLLCVLKTHSFSSFVLRETVLDTSEHWDVLLVTTCWVGGFTVLMDGLRTVFLIDLLHSPLY